MEHRSKIDEYLFFLRKVRGVVNLLISLQFTSGIFCFILVQFLFQCFLDQ